MNDAFAIELPGGMQKLLNQLAQAVKPKQAKKIESLGAAGRAWAKENDDYIGYLNATYLYIHARRKFTELVMPSIQHGGHNKQGRIDVTLLADFQLNKSEWHRRVRELEIPVEAIEKYFFDVSENRWNPSLAGLMNYWKGGGSFGHSHGQQAAAPIVCPNCGHTF